MRAEIIAVGTELLIGQVVNTNATFLSEELVGIGYDIYYHSVVGDNPERLKELIGQASQRSELIVLCGGLGPTEDDLTRDVLADYLKEPMVLDPEGYDKIATYMTRSGREMTENNRRQALTIQGGQAIPNDTGLAVGTFYQAETTSYLVLPGPPRELKPMFYHHVIPLLKQQLPQTDQLYSRVLRFFGIGESQLVLELETLIHEQTNPTIAPYAGDTEVRLRLTVKATDETTANEMLDEMEEKIMSQVGDYFYGYGEENSLIKETVKALKAAERTVASAESLTAGMFMSALGDVPGVSSVFNGGFVTYTNEMKSCLLKIDSALLAQHGAVSEACACAMAEQARVLTKSDYGVALTGVAGPDKSEGQPVGSVWIGLSSAISGTQAYHFQLQRDRQYIRQSAMMRAMDLLRRQVIAENHD
ncbi:competence/damage-inducible protein A [Vagococcus lutrae]|uniref:competence/damage-inducible protein A n=1 Tax=Vagococcus lutrae TaxID=81947 RepID=UPI000F8779B6|nr:competence/damage-inducible protein A [Vagococcus lutrae]RST91489.1 competence/damage-inducible protein A [Vagococcus lutrae]